MVPIAYPDAKVHIETASTGRPPKNMSENDFSRCRPSEEVFRFALVCRLVDLSDYFKNRWIDPIMFDF
jgi:hypothetical protein